MEKLCESCRTPLVRRCHADGRLEHTGKFSRRRFCDQRCAINGRAKFTPHEHGQSIVWHPIIADPPKEDRCWAGFVAGDRCTLARGNHETHRAASGREFVTIERREMPVVERNEGIDRLAEQHGMRNAWRNSRR